MKGENELDVSRRRLGGGHTWSWGGGVAGGRSGPSHHATAMPWIHHASAVATTVQAGDAKEEAEAPFRMDPSPTVAPDLQRDRKGR